MKLKIINEIPKEMSSIPVQDLHSLLGGPTLIDLTEGKKEALFISTLLHGNEHSGFIAFQELLREGQISQKTPLLFFIGNTFAAEKNLRHLPYQSDFNRVWSGGGACELAQVAQELLTYIGGKNISLSIDIHNNTGKNPFYACINKLENSFLTLANFFSDQIVYFTEPSEVHSIAMAEYCTSVTIEAGQSKEREGIDRLKEKLSYLITGKPLRQEHLSLPKKVLHTIGRIEFDPRAKIDFEENVQSLNDFSFKRDIDQYNFQPLPKGFSFGYVKEQNRFKVVGASGQDLTQDYFQVTEEGELLLKKIVILSMLSTNITVIKDDCFAYLMKELSIP